MEYSELLNRAKRSIWKRNFGCGIGTVVEKPVYTGQTQNYNFVITWIIQGEGEYTEDGKVYTLHDGCVCIRRPDRDYCLRLRSDGGIRPYLMIPQSVYPTLLHLIPELATVDPVLELPYHDACIEEFLSLYDRIFSLSSLELYNALPAMIHYILHITGIERNRARDSLLRGRLMLEEGVSLPLSEVANRCGMNYNTFRKHFVKAFGVSPAQYRIRYRISTAKGLLKNGMSVGEIANSLGYPDIYTFTHQFTAVTGISPTEFRDGVS